MQQVADAVQAVQLGGAHPAAEVLLADQYAQGMVAFQAGARRADADHPLAAQQFGGLVQRGIDAQRGVRAAGLARAVRAVDEAVAEAATVAEKVVVDLAVVAVLDAADLSVAFAGADVAAGRAAVTDAGGVLHVPLAGVALGMGSVGEYPGRADLGEVTGELAVQRAVLDAAEIQVVMGAEHAQVGAAGVIVVVAHASVTGDAAVHLVADERAEVLVRVGALAEAVAAAAVAGHHRHVLQMAMPAFLAHRTVVRVVDHQPLDDAGAKSPGFLVDDGDPGVVAGRCHAGHHQPAPGVVLVAELLHRALAAGTHAAQRRMPAEVGNVEAE